jgi:hypothetical protein
MFCFKIWVHLIITLLWTYVIFFVLNFYCIFLSWVIIMNIFITCPLYQLSICVTASIFLAKTEFLGLNPAVNKIYLRVTVQFPLCLTTYIGVYGGDKHEACQIVNCSTKWNNEASFTIWSFYLQKKLCKYWIVGLLSPRVRLDIVERINIPVNTKNSTLVLHIWIQKQ